MRQPCVRIARSCRWRHDLPLGRAGHGFAHHALLRRPCTQPRQFTASHRCSAKAPTHEWPALTATTRSGKNRINTSNNGLLTLAIETSCDDTCVAILEKGSSDTGRLTARLHFNDKVTADNRSFKGVYPDAAVASHVSSMSPLLQRALKSLPDATPAAANTTAGQTQTQNGNGEGIVWVDGRPRRKPDFVTVTRGPGMMSNLTVGVMTAKTLAVAWDVPLLAVNHMEAHALTPRLVHALEEQRGNNNQGEAQPPVPAPTSTYQPDFPFLSVLVSGGHSLLVHSRALNNHSILAQATNIAIGDLLDKCARLILPESYINSATDVMYGRLLEEFAFPSTTTSTTNPSSSSSEEDMYNYTPPFTRPDEQKAHHSTPEQGGWWLTPPMHESAAMGYDFSGLNGRVKTILSESPDMSLDQRRELAKQTMRLAFEHLASRLIMALKRFDKLAKEEEEMVATCDDSQARQESNESISSLSAAAGAHGQDPSSTAKPGTLTTRVKTVVVSGGVASNKYLRHILRSMLDVRGFADVQVICPPVSLCTDNAAMIAWTGIEMYEAGWRSALEVRPIKKWPLDPESAGGGILGADGWYRDDGEE